MGRKGKHLERAAANLGQSTRMCRTVSRVSEREHTEGETYLGALIGEGEQNGKRKNKKKNRVPNTATLRTNQVSYEPQGSYGDPILPPNSEKERNREWVPNTAPLRTI